MRKEGRLPDGFFAGVDGTDYLTRQAMCRALQWVERRCKCSLSNATPSQMVEVAQHVGKREKQAPLGDGEDPWQYLVKVFRVHFERKGNS